MGLEDNNRVQVGVFQNTMANVPTGSNTAGSCKGPDTHNGGWRPREQLSQAKEAGTAISYISQIFLVPNHMGHGAQSLT